jgi:dTMP kinase
LDKGEKVIKSREPGGTPIGSKLRDILLNSEERVPPLSEVLLFMADRNIHYHKVIKPYLEQGYIVLCDRFHLSTLVYQHHLKGNDLQLINMLHNYAVNNCKPDITLIFHGKRITENMKDLYELNLGDKSHEKLNKYYYDYGSYEGHFLINANRAREIIFEDILSVIGGR